MNNPFQDALRAAQALKDGSADDQAKAIRLVGEAFAQHTLELADYAKGAKLIDQLTASQQSAPAVKRIRVLLAGETNTYHMGLAIRVALASAGVLAEVREAPIGAWRQALLDISPLPPGEKMDLVIVDPWGLEIPGPPLSASADAVLEFARTVAESMRGYFDAALASGARVLLHPAVPTGLHLGGPMERALPAAPARFRETLNATLSQSLPSTVGWIDTAAVAERCGLNKWNDDRYRFHGNFPFSPACLDFYAREVAASYRAACGAVAKVLVVDLDNTLWGGVIGDDGLDGIRLGPETAEGAAHRAFCSYLIELHRRGVILAICSKNELPIAREVFEHHPHMPIRWEQFGAVRCNWQDKAANIRELAQELNVGTDSLVFVDDNPTECALIRATLPEVAVVELPADPTRYVRTLDEKQLFVRTRLTAEDLERSGFYERKREFERTLSSATDVDGFLHGLEMKAELAPARAEDIPRLAQLEAKTNQFNLATPRLSDAQLESFLHDDRYLVLAGHLNDRLGRHGLVTSVVARIEGDTLFMVSWLMSCRVFSRTLEHCVVNALLHHAASLGLSHLSATHLPTAKNGLLATVLPALGFVRQGDRDGAVTWRRPVNSDPLRTFVAWEAPQTEVAEAGASSRR